ncbi:MAG: HlyD family efflux transporter periplasmic adaptor subunit [Gammaproteobacteria bacterium]|jgi:hypothetical protein|nr:HlyD family efflux transporter periplasmic adaptor subunit [Gammaproteobacteria bacterium]MBT4082088.1 HlyD family efflux transporter periplasmic adaptor subunit [Gammaproteobacteria bacterium]MBT5371991.1 HlyD family efflux transporter periplasmic adaptor subunit [Gammaproteobacteria bacterium]MBT5635973.1 HlyD family efflux transporter periplasmic adaptor subunit [Gammaproteobacteria bacterium]MBT5687919.1 HlyD family efflux transporter periplasmic adaptor subunit [Gammaproteobacteria bact
MLQKETHAEPSEPEMNPVAQLLRLEKLSRTADSEEELTYLIVNETQKVSRYSEATLLLSNDGEHYKVVRLSHLAQVDRSAPFVTWVERLVNHYQHQDAANITHRIEPHQLESETRREWVNFSAAEMLWIPLTQTGRSHQGVLLLSRDAPWSEQEQVLLDHLGGAYAQSVFCKSKAHCLSLMPKRIKPLAFAATVCVLLLLLVPVRLSVLSSAEVTPYQPHLVTAPLNGVIAEVLVKPNQQVQPGQLLVRIEEEELNYQLDVSKQKVQVAKAALHRVEQASFSDPKRKAELAELRAELKLRESELHYAEELKQRASIHAITSGIAIIDDPQAWSGRPVQVGERILKIADEQQVEVTLMVAVKDAIALEAGGEVQLFLDTDPLNPLAATVHHASYEPQLGVDKIPSYKVIARFDVETLSVLNGREPRIGLRGIAKSYGTEVTLFYYLFRRPITALRQWLGW